MKIYGISDTHGKHEELIIPKCDLLLHAGDACNRGTLSELIYFLDWYSKQPSKYKIYVPGNHDRFCEQDPEEALRHCEDRGITLLNDRGVEIEGLKIYGSAVQPFFCNWAFNRMPGAEIQYHWDLIPKDLDILITHGPPYQILDKNMLDQACGCQQLLYKILEMKPKNHIFGHIHDNNGVQEFMGIHFYNVACCGESYKIDYPAMEIII